MIDNFVIKDLLIRNKLKIKSIIGLFLVMNVSLTAQWSINPDTLTQISPWGLDIKVCGDSDGGVYVLFNAYSGEFPHIYLQHLDRSGYKSWNNPIFVGGASDAEEDFDIVADGAGNAIIYFTEGTIADTLEPPRIVFSKRIKLHKYDTWGNNLWGSGVYASLDSADQFSANGVVSDYEGGAIALWSQKESFWDMSLDPHQTKVQRISAAGELLWGDSAIVVTDDYAYGRLPRIFSDGIGGAFVSWDSLYFEHFDSSGDRLWTAPKINATGFDFSQPRYVAAHDLDAGLVFVGRKRIPGSMFKLFALKISSSGDLLWGQDGIILADSLLWGESWNRWIICNDDSTYSFFWDYSPAGTDSSYSYLQSIDNNGNFIQGDPVQISQVNAEYRRINGVVSSIDNSAIIIFEDNRNGTDLSLYAQRIDAYGEVAWDAEDVLFSSVAGFSLRQLITDEAGGAIYIGSKPPLYGIWGQKIGRNGVLGEVITAVSSEENLVPVHPGLIINYPNPFNGTTTISFQITEPNLVELTIYNIIGEIVYSHTVTYNTPGSFEYKWNGQSQTGKYLASGVYIVVLKTTNAQYFRKMIMSK